MVVRNAAGNCPFCKNSVNVRHPQLQCLTCGRKVHLKCLGPGGSGSGGGEPSPATWTCDTCSRPKPTPGDYEDIGAKEVIALLRDSIEKNLAMAQELGKLRETIHELESQKAGLQQIIQKLQNNCQPSQVCESGVAIPPAISTVSPKKPPVSAPVPAAVAALPRDSQDDRAYAAVVAVPPPPTRSVGVVPSKRGIGTLLRQQGQHVSATHQNNTRPIIKTSDIYVACKDSKSKDAAVSLVKKHLQSVPNVMDHIDEVLPLKLSNTLVIKCSNAESRSIIKATLEKAIGDSYKIEHSRKPRREIKVHDVACDEKFPPRLEDGTVDKDAILNDILAKNNLLQDSYISVKNVEMPVTQGKPTSFARVNLLVDDKSRELLLGGNGIKIGWSRCRRLEEVCPIIQCYKCRGYNHTQAACWMNKKTPENKIICSICTENHRPKECPSKNQRELYNCINCVNHNNKQVHQSEPNILNQNHRADDRYKCQIYVRVCQIYEDRQLARD
jgi:hypothetical protein